MAANIKYPLDMNTTTSKLFIHTHTHAHARRVYIENQFGTHVQQKPRTQRHASSFMHAHNSRNEQTVQRICMYCRPMHAVLSIKLRSKHHITHVHIFSVSGVHKYAAATTTWRGDEQQFEYVFVRLWWILDGNIATSGFKITCSLFGMFGSI